MQEWTIRIERLCISSGHNYRGHHGKPAGTHPVEPSDHLDLVAGKGIVGDRYFGFKEDFKGQITFFDLDVAESLARSLGVTVDPAVTRRNVMVRGIDLNLLIGNQFELQGIRFEGVEECRPCYWMDQAISPGAEEALKGRGGLRARILTNGTLHTGKGVLRMGST